MDEKLEEKLTKAKKGELDQLVKLTQKRGMKGEKGDWKEFLKIHDKEVGASKSDPSKRTTEDILAFLHTFKEEADFRFFAKVMKMNVTREMAKKVVTSQDNESPEQRLVRLTLEHQAYAIDYLLPSYEEDWIVTKLGKASKLVTSNKLLAVDCEMVLCEDGTDALVKICVVDHNCKVKLHEFVKPDKAITDYRTEITGVSAEDLEGVTSSLVDVQKKLKKLLQSGAILVGHSLSNDLKALKIDHARVIDTSYIFKYGAAPTKRPSLNDLCKSVLGYEVRKKGAPHNCVDDACAAMKLVLAKLKNGDDVLPPVQDVVTPEVTPEMPNVVKGKLFLHRIPKDFPSEELRQVITGDFTIEVQATKKGRGDKYSAHAIFDTPQAAFDAYDNLQGDEGMDSYGRPQKPVLVQLKSGVRETIYACKLLQDNPPVELGVKRAPAAEVAGGEPKKLKTEQTLFASKEISCLDHVKEIKRLKEELSQRHEEIASLHKIIAALTRKQGL